MITFDAPTQIWVGSGREELSPGLSAAISLKMPTKTGMMKATTATSTTTATTKTSAGYISAERTWRRSESAFSTWKAIRSSASSSRPDCSPERTIARKRRSKTFGWRSIAASSELPASTSSRTPATAARICSSSVCSSRVCRVRSIGIPEATRVANWREKTASSRMSTPCQRLKRSSMLNGSCFSETSRTISPRWRSCSETWALESASNSPAVATPPKSMARNAKVVALAAIVA